MAGFPGGGRGANLFSNQNHGTTVQATGRVEQDGTIVLELQAERSRLIANRPAGEEGAAASVAANKTVQIRVNTTTRLASGKPTIVGSQATGVGKDAIHTYIVLTASAAEGGKAAAASDAKLNFFTLANARAGDISKVLREALTSMPFTIAADERSNSLIVSGPPDVLEIIRNLVARLDEAK
jgi:type II secretory pathway component GspD/PulD (secretin)